MRSATTTRHQGTLVSRRDPWDEDDAVEEEVGASWTKTYVGGMKVRQYAETTPADPGTQERVLAA